MPEQDRFSQPTKKVDFYYLPPTFEGLLVYCINSGFQVIKRENIYIIPNATFANEDDIHRICDKYRATVTTGEGRIMITVSRR
jgi:hypothetical protein